jgi:predicted AlkP superfamily phosphohydrolase/phosphomutase
MTQVLSIGLDGAAWHKLDRLMAAGDLPNLAALVEEGARAPLRSVDPPVTCPAWRCSTSGKNPGKLGVDWWLNLDRASGELTSPDARSFATADVWDYLAAEGKRSAVVNVPMTYPPEPVDGLMVSGFGAPFGVDLDRSITHPPDVQERLAAEYDWDIGVDDVTTAEGLERAYDLIDSRFELLGDLLEADYDYLHLTVFYINVLQHKYGDGPETREAWRRIDEHLGRLDDENVLTILYSDHGHDTVDRTFVVNRYLIENGYLSFDTGLSDSASGGAYSLLKRLSLSPRRMAKLAKAVLPASVYDDLVTSGYPVPTSELSARVDWEHTTALAVSQGPVYLNREALGDRYESFRDDLAAELSALTVDGEPVLDDVSPAEEVYTGEYVDDAPDLVLVAADGWEIYGGVTPSVFETQVTSWTSGNHPRGMLLLHGDEVEPGTLAERSLLDVMPTVLRYLDCPVPDDVDGEAVTDAFADGLGRRRTRPPLQPDPAGDADDSDELKRRLEDLGYLE